MLWLNLIVAGLMVALTLTIHLVGLVGLSAFLRRRHVHPVNLQTVFGQGVSILFVAVSLFALHSIEIWAYAFTYLALGQFEGIEPALYFSTSAFTTVGFGDVLPHDDWRMLGAAEGANGFLLIGWSTAFLVAVTARVRAFEANIERLDD